MIDLNVDDFPLDFEWDNDQFPPLDALTYWHFLKGAKRVIEVGCGYSTFLAHRSGVDLTAIDPEPRRRFPDILYNERPIQEVSIEIFKRLEENDILFVDSSHEVYFGSDVEHVLFKIIPILNKGVLVQFHDYFRPDDYPDSWKKDSSMSKWNEHYYVELAVAKYNFVLNNHVICSKSNHQLIEKYPFVPKDIKRNFGAVRGTSVWFRV